MKCYIKDFTCANNISILLRFKNKKYTSNSIKLCKNLVNFMKVNYIKVKCNLKFDLFCDGKSSRITHAFFITWL